MERKNASSVYRWLWFSPLLTIPTLIVILFWEPGYELLCASSFNPLYSGPCDYGAAERLTLEIGFIVSGLWHLVLIKHARNEHSFLVRWHGRQALMLAGVRTAAPLLFGLIFGLSPVTLLFIPIVTAFWLFGTIWGQQQAKHGDCSLARWFGHLAELEKPIKPDRQISQTDDVEALIKVIRTSHDQSLRDSALAKLKERGLVEEF